MQTGPDLVSVSSYKGIFYLENLRGDQLKEPPCSTFEKNAFRFDFGSCKVPQPENMHFYFHAFSGWGTSLGPKLNLKAFFS